MKILIAEDDSSTRILLQKLLERFGNEVMVAEDGTQAWNLFQKEQSISIVILDWMMPGIEGIELCRKIRDFSKEKSVYIIILTAKEGTDNVIKALEAGADDYITKPFNNGELNARVNVGKRIIELQNSLTNRITELELALSHVNQLQQLLPICSYCKNIRDDKNYWHEVDSYITKHSNTNFTHGICPDCYEKIIKPQIEDLKIRKKE